MLVRRQDLEDALARVYAHLRPTPALEWPLLSQRCSCELHVKHENHQPTGAFKVRGGITYFDGAGGTAALRRGVITATRGNHGQSVAWSARRHAIPAAIVVPHGNSPEKNRAMRALGAELIEHGRDFDEAAEHARHLAEQRELHAFPNVHPRLVSGVGTWAWEMLSELPDLEVLYVPIGLGSGICGAISAREALGHRCEIVGVVAQGAPAYLESFEAGRAVASERAETFADGLAVRVPDPTALEVICKFASRVVAVSEEQIRAAVRALFSDAHQVTEGAGAAGLAAVMAEPERVRGRRVGVVLSGANIDRDLFAEILRAEPEGAHA